MNPATRGARPRLRAGRTRRIAGRWRRWLPPTAGPILLLLAAIGVVAPAWLAGNATDACASTYAVFIPLDSSIYAELGELNGLGYLDTYMDEIRPIARVEAARLTIEAENNLHDSHRDDPLAKKLIAALRAQLKEEIGWLEHNAEDNQPTMIHPLERAEVEPLYSTGRRRYWEPFALTPSQQAGGAKPYQVLEGTPLLPNNDGLPTGAGGNEIVRLSGWAGVGGFLTGYAEGAAAGPFNRALPGQDRFNLLDGEVVLDMGNTALSFGQEEGWWGVGEFGPLALSDNTPPITGIRLQKIHPTLAPWIFRYLGPLRYQLFFGRLNALPAPYISQAWVDGEVISFKPLPVAEFGFFHQVDFGGTFNNNYSTLGFLARTLGPPGIHVAGANSHARAGLFVKFYLPWLRNAELYQSTLAEDKLLGFLPFARVSYQGGLYIPRLTEDGLTDLRVEYAITEPAYEAFFEGPGMALVYDSMFMGYPLGPNASGIDLQLGRWFGMRYKADVDFFYTEQAPGYSVRNFYPLEFYPAGLAHEYSGGVALDFWRLAQAMPSLDGTLTTWRARVAFEYAKNLNYAPGTTSLRTLVLLTGSFRPVYDSFTWQ
jgi:hypothetical protein